MTLPKLPEPKTPIEDIWVNTTHTVMPRMGDYVSVSAKSVHQFATALFAKFAQELCIAQNSYEDDNLNALIKSAKDQVFPCKQDEMDRMLDPVLADLRTALAAKDVEPVAYITETTQGPMVWTPEMYNEACTYCDYGEFPVPLFSHPAPDVEPVAKRNAAVVAMYDSPAPDAKKLSSQEIYDIAHLKATRYTCTAKPSEVMYGFSELHILDFVAALAAYKGEK